MSQTRVPRARDIPRISYTITEAIAATGIGRSTLFALIRDDRVKSVRIGRRRLILADSLRAFVEGAGHVDA